MGWDAANFCYSLLRARSFRCDALNHGTKDSMWDTTVFNFTHEIEEDKRMKKGRIQIFIDT